MLSLLSTFRSSMHISGQYLVPCFLYRFDVYCRLCTCSVVWTWYGTFLLAISLYIAYWHWLFSLFSFFRSNLFSYFFKALNTICSSRAFSSVSSRPRSRRSAQPQRPFGTSFPRSRDQSWRRRRRSRRRPGRGSHGGPNCSRNWYVICESYTV